LSDSLKDGELTSHHKFILNLVDRISSVVIFVVKAFTTLGIAVCVAYAISALAQTGIKADVNVNANANVVVHLFSLFDAKTKWGPWTIAVVAILYGLVERELRRRKTAYLQGRIAKLESKIDPDRSSSGLNKRGETPV
jgi:hypothetical protein